MLHGIALRYFVEVSNTGSIATASENLHVAVSAISRQIAKLEHEVGAPLFERMPRGMVLTDAGVLLLQHARRSLLEGYSVLAEISATRSLGGGIVRIGCSEGFTQYFLPGVMAAFHVGNPHARFVLRSGAPAQVERWVEVGDVDLGIAFSIATSTAINVEFSVNSPVCALMNPTHPLALKDVLTLDDLLTYPIVILERKTTVRQLIDLCCTARDKFFDPVLTTNNSSAAYQFTVITQAITLGSRMVLRGIQGEPALVAKAIEEPLLGERQLQVTSMKDRRLPPLVFQFLSELKKYLE